ncbi:FMN-binding protein [Raoultibacter phocaeensis]|uniref:FMN-binding protein n=1 Tax=Raoultibacter phocaeensis TaxID=2479841 RepID=UPI00111A0A6C|nr:FMN-binding protein [Raoultibacter phocaeensis]
MTPLLIIAAAIVVVAIGFGIVYLVRVVNYQNTVTSLIIETPPLESVAAGTYVGSFDADIIGATVSVSVENGRITEIELLEHKTERGQAAEAITDAIVEAQRIDIDTISGATNSSKVIQKAVENALLHA